MCLELLHIGPVTVRAYGLMMAGFLAAGLVTAWGFRRRKLPVDIALVALIDAMVGGMVGAKLNYAVVPGFVATIRADRAASRGMAASLVELWQWWPCCRPRGRRWGRLWMQLRLRSLGMVSAAESFSAVRCYGSETDFSWGWRFQGSRPPKGLVHPTQLYELGFFRHRRHLA